MPSSSDNAGKAIDSYCACAVDQTVDELSSSRRTCITLKLNPSSEPAASKMQGIINAKCHG